MARPGAGGINAENRVRGAENSGGRPSGAAPRTAPSRAAPSPACAALPPGGSRSALSDTAAPWQNPTCSHPLSQPHSFSRSGFISTLTVIIFFFFFLTLSRPVPIPSCPFCPLSLFIPTILFFCSFRLLSSCLILSSPWLQTHQPGSLHC